MDWQATWDDPFTTCLRPFHDLIGDARTGSTLTETVTGIIAAGALMCHRIAAHSALRAQGDYGAQRSLRMATGESIRRAPNLDAAPLTAKLRDHAVAHLSTSASEDVWLIADMSELRKPYAQAMPQLLRGRALEGGLVNGYRTLTVLGLTPNRRGVRSHRRFSRQAPDFLSESQEVQQALTMVSQTLAPLKERMTVTWVLDSGCADVAVWRTIWEQDEHLVCRSKHRERFVSYQDQHGAWQAGDLAAARQRLRWCATVETLLVVQRGRQKRPKEQRVPVERWACPIRLRSDTNVRRPGTSRTVEKDLWLVEVRIPDTTMEPWWLLTDWAVGDGASATRRCCLYRQRWAVEDSFKFTKACLGWEEVQVLQLEGSRTLVALAWVAAGFLYALGVTLAWAEVALLARRGGWVPHKDRKPGKLTLTRGLQRLLDMLTTEAIGATYLKEHGSLPNKLAALLQSWQPTKEL